MSMLSHSQVMPFLMGLSVGLFLPFLCYVLAEAFRVWSGRSRVVSLGHPAPRANVSRVRGVKTFP